MEITEIKQIGKSENFRIFLDNNYFCCLTMETIVKNKIACGMEIDKQTLTSYQFESEKIVAFDKACNYLAKGIKSEYEIKKFLKTKGYLQEIINYVCEKLHSYGYLDDKAYAKEYINSYSKQKGKKALEFALLQRGISKSIINEELSDFNGKPTALILATKYIKNKELNLKTKQSLYRYLLSKGFDYDEVTSVTNNIFNGE